MNLHYCLRRLPLLALIVLPYLKGSSGTGFPSYSFKSCLLGSGLPRTRIISRRARCRNQYNYLNYQWNQYYSQKIPLAYILPQSAEEVSAVVKCGSSHKVPVVPKSGGHSYPKYSFGNQNSVVLDFQNMANVALDLSKKTVEVDSGLLNGQLTAYLLQFGLFMPNGLCPTVGMAVCLGGGYSTLVRSHGLIMDGLQELDVVDSEGALITTSRERNRDLFWALRGAGLSGSFGIVTRYKFRVYEVPGKVVSGRNTYELASFPRVFNAFQNYCKSNPSKDINFSMLMNQTNVLVKVYQVFKSGAEGTVDGIKSILSLNFPPTKITSIEALDFKGFLQLDSGNFGNVTRHDFGPRFFKAASFYVGGIVPEAMVDPINAAIQRLPKYLEVEFSANGGRINDVKPTETAFVHREQNLYRVRLDYEGPVGRSQHSEEESIRWIREFFQLTKTTMNHTESYQNYADPELKDYLERYYGPNLKRLKEIKLRFDPNNYFNYNPQAIPPL